VDDQDWRLAAKADALKIRAQVTDAIRRFFRECDFLEIDTPVRIPAPAPEAHIDAVRSDGWFLQTSPELCMKRLLAAGYPQIFQICRCFRAGERGTLHLPEFTLVEWYRAGADYAALMDDCEQLVAAAAAAAGRNGRLVWQGRNIDLSPPWERVTVQAAFQRYAGYSPGEALAANRFDETLALAVEPQLGLEKPVFLTEYPAPLAALARLKPGDPSVAERFELYLAGLELANAFSELTDAAEQRRRFAAAEADRRRGGLGAYPPPEPFLAALPRMPASAGIALGLDRLVMLLADAPRIDDVVAFTPETL
jgi:lysyl-tRNA synthetase class 2